MDLDALASDLLDDEDILDALRSPSSSHAASTSAIAASSSSTAPRATSACWGFDFTCQQGNCIPDFALGFGHLKNKFCPNCQNAGLTIDPARARLLPPEHQASFGPNPSSGGLWAKKQGASFRVVNQTIKCRGFPILVVRNVAEASELCVGLPEIPSEWCTGGQLHLSLAKGTLVPTALLRLKSGGVETFSSSVPAHPYLCTSAAAAPSPPLPIQQMASFGTESVCESACESTVSDAITHDAQEGNATPEPNSGLERRPMDMLTALEQVDEHPAPGGAGSEVDRGSSHSSNKRSRSASPQASWSEASEGAHSFDRRRQRRESEGESPSPSFMLRLSTLHAELGDTVARIQAELSGREQNENTPPAVLAYHESLGEVIAGLERASAALEAANAARRAGVSDQHSVLHAAGALDAAGALE